MIKIKYGENIKGSLNTQDQNDHVGWIKLIHKVDKLPLYVFSCA